MSEVLIETMPAGGWTVADLEALPVSNVRYEITDGALTVSPSPPNLHQAVAVRLATQLEALLPPPFVVASAVEIRFARQLTRIPDLTVVHSDEPGRHWFAPSEVVVAIEVESPGNHIEDRTTKPAIYAQFGIRHYWRIEPKPSRATIYRLGDDDTYHEVDASNQLVASEPFPVDVPLSELLPRWAREN